MLLNWNDTFNNDAFFEMDKKRIEILSDQMDDWITDTPAEDPDSMSPPVQNVCLPDFLPLSTELEQNTTTGSANIDSNVL
jgi:hypothetical protein